MGYPQTHCQDSTHRAIQVGTWHQLVTSLSINFTDECIHHIPTKTFGPSDGPSIILIIGDTYHRTEQIYIIPEVQTVGPGKEILVQI